MQEAFEKIIDKIKNIMRRPCGEENCQFEESCCENIAFMKAIEIVKQVAAEHNNGWIPCSERLPEENVNVIVCFAHGLVMELSFYNGLFHGLYDYNTNVIVAWQPLPEPYQPENN